MGLHQIKKLLHSEGNYQQKTKRPPTEWEKIFANNISEKGLISIIWASLVAQLVKNPPAMQETWIQSLYCEDALEKGIATHSNILA